MKDFRSENADSNIIISFSITVISWEALAIVFCYFYHPGMSTNPESLICRILMKIDSEEEPSNKPLVLCSLMEISEDGVF